MTQAQLDLVDMSGSDDLVALSTELERLERIVKDYTKARDRIRTAIEGIIGDHDGVQVGNKVYTYQYTNRYQVVALRKALPDLTGQFVYEVTREEFDMDRFKAAFPAIAKEYQSRSWGSGVA